MTLIPAPLPVPLRSDFEGYCVLRRRNPVTGKRERAAGLTGVVMYFAATKGGAAIHAEVTWPLAELTGSAGAYLGVLDEAHVTTHLEPLGEGTRLWKATVKPGDRTVWRECVLVHEEV